MSKKVLRVITGVTIAILLVPFVIIGNLPFDILVGVIFAAAMIEMISLKKCNIITKIGFVLIGIGLMTINILEVNEVLKDIYLPLLFIIFLFTLLFLTLSFFIDKDLVATDVYFLFTIMLIYTAASYALLKFNSFDNKERYLLFGLTLLPTIACDTFAYVFGSKYGKTKYIKKISPNKSLEGAIAGYVFGLVVGMIIIGLGVHFECIPNSLLIFSILILPITCQIGDLFFSSIKRLHQVVDYSNLLPGHGGINDRINSTIFNAIVLLAFILL